MTNFDLGEVSIIVFNETPEIMEMIIKEIVKHFGMLETKRIIQYPAKIEFTLYDDETSFDILDNLFDALVHEGVKFNMAMKGYQEVEGGYIRETEVSGK